MGGFSVFPKKEMSRQGEIDIPRFPPDRNSPNPLISYSLALALPGGSGAPIGTSAVRNLRHEEGDFTTTPDEAVDAVKPGASRRQVPEEGEREDSSTGNFREVSEGHSGTGVHMWSLTLSHPRQGHSGTGAPRIHHANRNRGPGVTAPGLVL